MKAYQKPIINIPDLSDSELKAIMSNLYSKNPIRYQQAEETLRRKIQDYLRDTCLKRREMPNINIPQTDAKTVKQLNEDLTSGNTSKMQNAVYDLTECVVDEIKNPLTPPGKEPVEIILTDSFDAPMPLKRKGITQPELEKPGNNPLAVNKKGKLVNTINDVLGIANNLFSSNSVPNYQAGNGQQFYQNNSAAATPSNQPNNSNNLIYLAVGGVVLLVLIIILLRK